MIFHDKDLKTLQSDIDYDIYTTPFKDGAFLLHRSVYLTYLRLFEYDKELAHQYVQTVCDYAFERYRPEEDDPIWIHGLDVLFEQLDIDAGRSEPLL